MMIHIPVLKTMTPVTFLCILEQVYEVLGFPFAGCGEYSFHPICKECCERQEELSEEDQVRWEVLTDRKQKKTVIIYRSDKKETEDDPE